MMKKFLFYENILLIMIVEVFLAKSKLWKEYKSYKFFTEIYKKFYILVRVELSFPGGFVFRSQTWLESVILIWQSKVETSNQNKNSLKIKSNEKIEIVEKCKHGSYLYSVISNWRYNSPSLPLIKKSISPSHLYPSLTPITGLTLPFKMYKM